MEDQHPRTLIGGIAARFANSENLQDFWENLVDEKNVLSSSRWPPGLYNLPNKHGLLPNIDQFDNDFFDIPASEVDSLNPVFRQLLEVVYECVVDSCLPLSTLQETRTGLYVACSRSDNDCVESSRCLNSTYNTCSEYLAGELIRWLKIRGPSVTVNSADNSGISALNLAITDLLSGSCTYALVTGCDVVLNPLVTKQLHILESHVVRSEGCVAMLLARNHEDLSRIYCSVLDIGLNYDSDRQQDSRSLSEQSEFIYDRLQRCNNASGNNTVCIDNHGVYAKKSDAETAKVADEKIETLVLADTVSGQFGHTESVSGLSTILTCILAFQHGDILTDICDFPETFVKTRSSTKTLAPCEQGNRCVNYYLIIEPYLSSKTVDTVCQGDIIVPFTVRNPEGMYDMMEFVKCHRHNSDVLGLLSQSLLSCDQSQPIRGYIHAGARDELTLYHDACYSDLDSLYLCLDDFMASHVSMATDLLELTGFHTALKQCQKSIQLLDPMLDIVSVLKKSEPLSPCNRVGLLAAASLFMSMIDSLETIGLEFDGSIGCGLSEILAAYMDGCISRDQCFLIYSVIGKQLEQFSEKYGDKWVVYHVDINYEEAYQLGPWVQVLSIHDKQHVTLAVEKERCGGVLEKILLKGGSFEQSSIGVPVYSLYMKELTESVTQQLKDMIPSPVRRSNRLISARRGWNQGQSQDQVVYDADYISKLLCHPVNLFEARAVAPPDCLVLSLKPSITQNIKEPDQISQKKGLQYNVGSVCTGFQENLSSTNMGVTDHVTCNMSKDSFCQAVGKLHIQGIDVDVSAMYKTTHLGPAGIDVPCFSPLVRWNHHISWEIPHWMEFSATVEEERLPYTIELEDGGQRPVALLLYHVWKAISDTVSEHLPLCSIRLYGITGWNSDVLHDYSLNGAQIYVLPHTGIFTAVLEDYVLLQGKFDIDIKGDLPCVPGYDLDINENIDPSSSKLSETDSDKTEIQWEDSWLDFMDNVLEFAEENLGSMPSELLVNTSYHYHEAKDCSNFLTVAEKYTGLCRAGGVVFRFATPISSDDLDLEKTCISVSSQSVANYLMVYSVNDYKTQNNKIMMYNGYKEEDGKPMVGIVNFAGETKLTETQVTADWKTEHMEVIIPYILAANVVNNVAKVTEKQHVAILPPLDSVSMYMIVLCLEKGCTVYTSTHDLETKHLLEDVFPSLNVLHDEGMYKELMCHTRGLGVDVCIRVSGGDIRKLLDCTAWNGHAIQCMAPDENGYCHTPILHRNSSLSVVDCALAVDNFIQSGDKNFEQILAVMNNERMQKLHKEGFPESIGMLYKQEVVARLEKQFPVNDLLLHLLEPNIEHSDVKLSQHDAKYIEKIQTFVSPRPKDYSVADTSCLLENPLKRIGEDDPFNTGMMATPLQQQSNSLSPDVNVITFSESFAEKKVSPITSKNLQSTEKVLPTSTPLVCPTVQCVSKKLEESYLDDDTNLPGCTEVSFHIFNDSIREDRDEDAVDDDEGEGPKTSEPEQGMVLQQTVETLSRDNEDMKASGHDKIQQKTVVVSNSVNKDEKTNARGEAGEANNVTHSKKSDGKEIPGSNLNEKASSRPDTNRVLIEDEGVERTEPEESIVSKGEEVKPNKNWMLKELKGRMSTGAILSSEGQAERPVPKSLVKRLSSLGFDRPATPIVKKTPTRDLFRHRMLQKQNLVPPRLPLPRPKVDLLVFARPMTPHTPDLQEVLSPRLAPNVVPLNSPGNADTPPLFIIHTITGCTNMFQNVAKHLDFQCYGLQLTGATPTGSIDEMARYYKDVIMMKQTDGPYRIAGHSYSSILALEIAVYLQQEGKQVDYLVILDGSPLLTQHQINQGLKHLSSNSSKHEVDEALCIGALVSWIEHYGQMQNKLLTYGLLKKLPSLNERIDTAVDLSFGTAIISCSPVKTRWLTAKEKVLQMMKSSDLKTNRLADAARELVRLKRRQRALDFIKQMQLNYTYQLQKPFDGSIHLFRVKQDPQLDVPQDYGLQTMCSGEVHVKLYQASPEKFVATEAIQPLSKDLNVLLK